ncbi:MAG: hypothetical protein ACRDJB_09275, partial [Actinomycetota bacterium]
LEHLPFRLIETDERGGSDPRISDSTSVFLDMKGSALKAFNNVVTPRLFVVDGDGLVLEVALPRSVAHMRAITRRIPGGATDPGSPSERTAESETVR